MSVPVGDIIKASAGALGIEQRKMLSQLADFVKPDVGGESDPSRDTILSYEHAPQTRCGYKFAGMVLDFLHSRLARIKDLGELSSAQQNCWLVLRKTRHARYLQPLRTNAASLRRIPRIGGVYVLIRRRASGVQVLRQELLILNHQGRGDIQTFATYITPELVCRGTWCAIQQNVSCSLHGYRDHYTRRDVVHLQLLYEPSAPESPVLLSGLMTGMTSQVLHPVVLPIFAIKVGAENLSPELTTIGDGGDLELRAAWSSVAANTTPHFEIIGDILNDAMQPDEGTVTITEREITARILKECPDIEGILDKSIYEFCRTYNYVEK